MKLLKSLFFAIALIALVGGQFLAAGSPVSAKLFDTSAVVELTEDNGITHIPNERGFTTLVDRDKLPESVRSFVKISVRSSDGPMTVNKDNIENYIGGFSVYDDSGFNSGLSRSGKYYNLTILYSGDNIPLAYYSSSVNYGGNGDGDSNGGSQSTTVDSLALSEESLTILPGKTVKIHVYAIMGDGNEKDVTRDSKTVFRSSSASVASVSKGMIKAGSKTGKATIAITYNGKKATLPVSVTKDGVVKLAASVKGLNIDAGDTASVDLIATMSNNTKKDVTSLASWTTDDSEVAVVDKGEVEGVAEGEATITAFYQGYEVSFKVNVTEVDENAKEVESLQITDKNVKLLLNEEKTLNVMAVYTDGTREDVSDQVTWTTSKNSVAEIEDGILTGNALGVVTITAALNGAEATLRVEVKKDKAVKLLKTSSSKLTINRGAEDDVTITAYYTDGTKRDVSTMSDWKVSKSGIVKVEDGVITAGKTRGTTIITANYNGRSVKITVTVK